VIATHALLAMHAALTGKTNANALPDFNSSGARTDSDHPSDDLVPEDGGELGKSPFVIAQRKV